MKTRLLTLFVLLPAAACVAVACAAAGPSSSGPTGGTTAPAPVAATGSGPAGAPERAGTVATEAPLLMPDEKHLRNVRQLTFGGENAEAYFSADDRLLIFQGHEGEGRCDQIYIMGADGGGRRMVSTGKGKTTCAYFYPDGKRILYGSTHGGNPDCPPPTDFKRGYVWTMDPNYDIYSARPDGSRLKRLTDTPGYDAEATISRDGRSIVFTSARDGDLDLYVMDAGGKNVRRLTNEEGYDGGAFFSFDGRLIVYRAHHPRDPAEIEEYRALLKTGLLKPRRFELFVMNADGSDKRPVTSNGAANFAPFFHPDGKRIIFASNLHNPGGHNFDLFIVNVDGSGLERITTHEMFDSFPMFTSDGKKLVWASNRNQKARGETNIFIADWVE